MIFYIVFFLQNYNIDQVPVQSSYFFLILLHSTKIFIHRVMLQKCRQSKFTNSINFDQVAPL